MERPLLAALGIALVGVVVIDLAWTTFAVGAGRGPLTNTLARGVWSMVRGTTRHRLLQGAGYSILIGLLLTWALGMWGGWALLFNADDASVVNSASHEPGSVLARIAYAGGALAGAGAGYTASSDGWQLANNIAALLGLALFTLALTYLFQVVNAASQKRGTALHINGLGESPAAIVAPGLGQSSLGPVGSQITSLASNLALIARQHLALPVLHYLHVPERSASIELAIARLDEALNIIEYQLRGDHAAIVRPARTAITDYLATIRLPGDDRQAPPAPDLSAVERRSGEMTDQGTFRERLEQVSDRRRRLRTLIEDNGWEWESDVLGRSGFRPLDDG